MVIAILVGLGLGAGAGAGVGWLLQAQQIMVEMEDLHPEYKADYTIMVAQSYVLTEDWDLAQSQLGRLGESDPAGYVVQLAERYIDEGRNPDEIRLLVRLAARYGVVTEPMQPFLPNQDG
ncbi:MAG: hypothetical protein ACFB51_04225 [Anaerolineae bacterium]